jgi:hypothetical protein
MRESGRETATSTENEDRPVVRLDPYDPCEIDPPLHMFAWIGAALALVFGIIAAAEYFPKLTQ